MPEPIRGLFERSPSRWPQPGVAGAFLAGRRMVAIDGTTLDVADTAANEEFCPAAAFAREASAFPQARIVALAECATSRGADAGSGPTSSRRRP